MKPWANFLNEWAETRYIPWTESCPWCEKPTFIGWHGYDLKKDELEIALDVWYCVECDTVLNMNEDDPKADIRWLTEAEAREKGLEPVEVPMED